VSFASARFVAALGLAVVLGSSAAAAWATAPGPNGKLVFRRYFDTPQTWGGLFTANPDGTSVQQITRPVKGVLDNEPDWSPDGSKIVFERAAFRARRVQIYTVNDDGTGLKRILPSAACDGGEAPAWTPDGERIAFLCHYRLVIVNADGTRPQPVTSGSRSTWWDGDPQFSPDGTRVVFQRIDPRTKPRAGFALFIVNADGTGERRLTPWALRAGDHPDWSPDGKRILFRSNINGPTGVSANLYTIRPDGTGLTQLTHARGGRVQNLSASFSPDGKWITFSRTPGTGKDGNADVFVMRANGSGVRNVTRSEIWDSATDWGARG
jgi:Tol biopolymer transport system component